MQALGPDSLVEQIQRIVDHLQQGKVGFFEGQSAHFDFRQVEHVVDDAEQVLSGIVDLSQLGSLPGVGDLLQQQVREPEDGVHRCADLVAHVRQKRAFRPAGGLGAFLGFGELRRAQLDQFLQVIAVSLELCVGAIAFGQIDVDAEELRRSARRLQHHMTRKDGDSRAVLVLQKQFRRGNGDAASTHFLDRLTDRRTHFLWNDQFQQVAANRLGCRITVQLLGGRVPEAGCAVGRITLHRDRVHLLEEPAEPFLGVPQGVGRQLVFGDVARVPDGADDLAVQRNGRLVGFEPAACAAGLDQLLDPLRLAAGENGQVVCTVRRSEFRRGDQRVGLAQQRRARGLPEGGGEARVDRQEAALVILQPDQEREVVEQRALVLITRLQRCCGIGQCPLRQAAQRAPDQPGHDQAAEQQWHPGQQFAGNRLVDVDLADRLAKTVQGPLTRQRGAGERASGFQQPLAASLRHRHPRAWRGMALDEAAQTIGCQVPLLWLSGDELFECQCLVVQGFVKTFVDVAAQVQPVDGCRQQRDAKRQRRRQARQQLHHRGLQGSVHLPTGR